MAKFCLLYILLGAALAEESLVAYTFAGRGSAGAVADVLSRVLKLTPAEVSAAFELEVVPKCQTPRPASAKTDLCFDLMDSNGRVRVAATSGPELAYGAAWYLRTRCNMSFSWNRTGGHNTVLPKAWPRVGKPITRYRSVPMSYFNNVVTFSYSYVWYNFSEWEAWLDWAALSGINLVCSYTGQEEIYRKTFNSFGVNDSEFAAWSNGAAWLAWSRGQSMHGIGNNCGDACTPLPQTWMTRQWQLQKQILEPLVKQNHHEGHP